MIEELSFEGPAESARARVLGLTLGIVRRRRRARQALAAAVVIAAYAAGVATPALFDRSGARAPEPAQPAAAVLVLPPTPPSPVSLESQAIAAGSDAERSQLLRTAGDRYLGEANDVAAALRCYREMLKLASSTDRARFDPADTWLLAALKRGSD